MSLIRKVTYLIRSGTSGSCYRAGVPLLFVYWSIRPRSGHPSQYTGQVMRPVQIDIKGAAASRYKPSIVRGIKRIYNGIFNLRADNGENQLYTQYFKCPNVYIYMLMLKQ